jgi:hypothetical protein
MTSPYGPERRLNEESVVRWVAPGRSINKDNNDDDNALSIASEKHLPVAMNCLRCTLASGYDVTGSSLHRFRSTASRASD